MMYYRMVQQNGTNASYYPTTAIQPGLANPALAPTAPGLSALTGYSAAGLPPVTGGLASPAAGAGSLMAGAAGAHPGITSVMPKFLLPNFTATQIQYMFRRRLGERKAAKAVRCETCDLTLNSEQQAQQHFSGKSHLKKLKKATGGGDKGEKGDDKGGKDRDRSGNKRRRSRSERKKSTGDGSGDPSSASGDDPSTSPCSRPDTPSSTSETPPPMGTKRRRRQRKTSLDGSDHQDDSDDGGSDDDDDDDDNDNGSDMSDVEDNEENENKNDTDKATKSCDAENTESDIISDNTDKDKTNNDKDEDLSEKSDEQSAAKQSKGIASTALSSSLCSKSGDNKNTPAKSPVSRCDSSFAMTGAVTAAISSPATCTTSISPTAGHAPVITLSSASVTKSPPAVSSPVAIISKSSSVRPVVVSTSFNPSGIKPAGLVSRPRLPSSSSSSPLGSGAGLLGRQPAGLMPAAAYRGATTPAGTNLMFQPTPAALQYLQPQYPGAASATQYAGLTSVSAAAAQFGGTAQYGLGSGTQFPTAAGLASSMAYLASPASASLFSTPSAAPQSLITSLYSPPAAQSATPAADLLARYYQQADTPAAAHFMDSPGGAGDPYSTAYMDSASAAAAATGFGLFSNTANNPTVTPQSLMCYESVTMTKMAASSSDEHMALSGGTGSSLIPLTARSGGRGSPADTSASRETPTTPKLDPVTQAVYDNMMGKLPGRKRKLEIQCSMCEMTFNSQHQADAHFSGSRHAKRQKDDSPPTGGVQKQTSGATASSSGGSPPQQAAGRKAGWLYCQHCDVSFPSPSRLHQHLNSTEHQSRVR